MSKLKIPLLQAQQLAWKILNTINHECERILVAGSIRRYEPVIGDIEIVAIPKQYEVYQKGLFKEDNKVRKAKTSLDVLLDELVVIEKRLLKGEEQGNRHKNFIIPSNKMSLDLYLATPDNWGYILALRTGSALFNQRMVTRNEGENDTYGLLDPRYYVKDEYVWNDQDVIVPVLYEPDFFKLLRCGWICPWDRF